MFTFFISQCKKIPTEEVLPFLIKMSHLLTGEEAVNLQTKIFFVLLLDVLKYDLTFTTH